jgi:hypothetical protein
MKPLYICHVSHDFKMIIDFKNGRLHTLDSFKLLQIGHMECHKDPLMTWANIIVCVKVYSSTSTRFVKKKTFDLDGIY